MDHDQRPRQFLSCSQTIIKRDMSRPEEDDWKLRVQHHLTEFKESLPLYDEIGTLPGWKIQYRYE